MTEFSKNSDITKADTTLTTLISLCVCTFRRPEGINRALNSLIDAEIPQGWRAEFIVVDNDDRASASEIVKSISAHRPAVVIRYFIEPKSGVSHARNRCLREARGSILTFIDDDEYVKSDWLVQLVLTLEQQQADAVFGPVIPCFETAPPPWVESTGAHYRARFPTGSIVDWKNAQTNNVAFRRTLLNSGNMFSVYFTKTGGEDSLFFAKAAASGQKLVWCDDAIVTETVPIKRMTRRWVLERAFNGGRTFVRLQAIRVSPLAYVFYAVYGLLLSILLIPPFLLTAAVGDAKHMKYASRLFGNLGKIAARFYGGGHYGG
jgi:succinoglycan biosynthesis protein ExoM